MNNLLDDDERVLLENYESAVFNTFSAKFKHASGRFSEGDRLLNRFASSVAEVRKRGREFFSAVDEAHNEICIAAALLSNAEPLFVRLHYEPPLVNTKKSIDFCVETRHGPVAYVDVKTIKPQPKDRWDHYEKANTKGWFPRHANFLVAKEWFGGEIWHGAVAARARMLEHTLELERKIADAQLATDASIAVLALCGDMFHWDDDELEDFVAFYRTGRHRADDPFSAMERKYLEDKKRHLDGTVSQFACLQRPHGRLLPTRLNWNVRAPANSYF